MAAAVLKTAPERFALTGLSMGGIVAIEMIRQAPDRIAGVALLDTNPHAEQPQVTENRARQIKAVLDGKLEAVIREEMKPLYLADSPERTKLLDLCMDMAMDMGPEVFQRQSRALAQRKDQSATLAAYHGRSLVLCGKQDRLCPPARHEYMCRIMPNATLTIVEDAGHLPTLEQPTATNAAFSVWKRETNAH